MNNILENGLQSYEKTREMQKENLFFFSFPSNKDSKLVSLGSSKNFGEAQNYEKLRAKQRNTFLFFAETE